MRNPVIILIVVSTKTYVSTKLFRPKQSATLSWHIMASPDVIHSIEKQIVEKLWIVWIRGHT